MRVRGLTPQGHTAERKVNGEPNQIRGRAIERAETEKPKGPLYHFILKSLPRCMPEVDVQRHYWGILGFGGG